MKIKIALLLTILILYIACSGCVAVSSNGGKNIIGIPAGLVGDMAIGYYEGHRMEEESSKSARRGIKIGGIIFAADVIFTYLIWPLVDD
ncbi:MAG: hypothetical protein HY811_05530 [Planctomycetes bacterium]|nr:hypothetical protein [Planctomycetota bacterium]